MQQVQGTVLNKIIPGATPVFIVAPNVGDAEYLSLYLSHYLSARQQKDRVTATVSNYFYNGELRGFFAPAGKDAVLTADSRDAFKFMLDRYFQNGDLWGAACNYQQFCDIGFQNLYADSFFIFLYGTGTGGADYNGATWDVAAYAGKVLQYCQQHPANSVLVRTDNTLLFPGLILESLPIAAEFFTQPLANTPLKKNVFNAFGLLEHIMKVESGMKTPGKEFSVYEQMDRENLLKSAQRWIPGSDLLIVFDAGVVEESSVITDRIARIIYSFIGKPRAILLCDDVARLKEIEAALGAKLPAGQVQAKAVTGSMADAINNIVNSSAEQFILVDDVHLQYELTDLLSPLLIASPPALVFADEMSVGLTPAQNTWVGIAHLLSDAIVCHAVAFTRRMWQQLSGVGDMAPEVLFWDMCIRALLQNDQYAVRSAATRLSKNNKDAVTPIKVPPLTAVNEVFRKYRKEYEANFPAILQLMTSQQYDAQRHKNELLQSIIKLSNDAAQAKENLEVLSLYNAQLQGHINKIERSKFYRVGKRIKHYTRIFAKGKHVESSRVQRSLKFILFAFTKQGLRLGRKILRTVLQKLYLWLEDRPVKLIFTEKDGETSILSYDEWIAGKLDPGTLQEEYGAGEAELTVKPKFSVVVPVYNPPIQYLREAIESVLAQNYTNWELCIADDNSPDPNVRKLLNTYALKNPWIKVMFREQNGHIAACSNSALSLATGDYVVLLDHDDVLTPNCLFELARHINKHPEDKLIYSDEDKLNSDGSYSDPFFKPAWSPDRFLAINYISHVVCMDRKIVEQIGGFREGFEGSQDYDILLRFTEASKHVGHIPKVLYHWRAHEMSVADANANAKPYAYIAARRALQEALERRDTPGDVQYLTSRGSYRINYKVQNPQKVSIIIPTKDQSKLVKKAIDSIFELTDYPDYEIILLDNNSNSKEFFDLVKEYQATHADRFRCVEAKYPFNFAKLMNHGRSLANGEYLLFLNNDVEVIHTDWMTRMVSYAQHKWTGAVGVKLLYPDDTIQHAGTVIGIGACAGHILVGEYKDNNGYFNCIQTTVDYSAVTAACLMVRTEVFDEVGGWDETLEVEYNDVDFCLSIREKGYYNVYVADVTLYHYESATRGHPHQTTEAYKRHVREVAYFKEKWASYLDYDPFYNPNFKAINMTL